MNNKTLTYSQYLKRSKELKTPEDIAAFAQELIAPLMGSGSQNGLHNERYRESQPSV